MPVLRNTRRGPVVLVDADNREYNWEGAGDPLGRDYQQIPEQIASDANCVRQVRKGILQLVGEEEGAAKLDDQLAAWEQAEKVQHDGVQALIDRGQPDRETVLEIDEQGKTQRVEHDAAGPTPRRSRHPNVSTEHPETGTPPPPEADSAQPPPSTAHDGDDTGSADERVSGPRTVRVPGEESFVSGHDGDDAESGTPPSDANTPPADGPYDGPPAEVIPSDSPSSYQELIERAARSDDDPPDTDT